MDFNYSNKSLELQESLLKFFDEHIYPNEIDYDKAIEESGDPLHIPAVLEDLKEEAKKINLWNLFLPDENHGPGLSNLDYAPLAEIMGRVGGHQKYSTVRLQIQEIWKFLQNLEQIYKKKNG